VAVVRDLDGNSFGLTYLIGKEGAVQRKRAAVNVTAAELNDLNASFDSGRCGRSHMSDARFRRYVTYKAEACDTAQEFLMDDRSTTDDGTWEDS